MLGAARNCPRLTLALALLLAAGPAQALQSPSAPTRSQLEALYNAASQATAAGDHVTAAERHAEVLGLLPESHANHDSRALALLDSVGSRRQAQASGAPGSQLCLARALVRDYLATARATYGGAAAELDGVRQAEQLRDELDRELAGLPDPSCPEEQVVAPPSHHPPLQLAPPPGPDRDRRLPAGAALLGVSGLGLGLMALGLGLGARAEQAGREARAADPTRDIDELLADGFIQRGRTGNHLAIAGGVLAGVTAVVGTILLARVRTRPRHAGADDRRARIAPTLHPGGVGLRF